MPIGAFGSVDRSYVTALGADPVVDPGKWPYRDPSSNRTRALAGPRTRYSPESDNRTAQGRQPEALPVGEEFTRDCPTIEVERSLVAKDAVSMWGHHLKERRIPENMPGDNGRGSSPRR